MGESDGSRVAGESGDAADAVGSAGAAGAAGSEGAVGTGGAAGWTDGDLRLIGGATELRVSSFRADGSLRPAVTIWHAVLGDALYIRSAHGPENGWFRRALAAGSGRIESGGVETDVTFELAPEAVRPELDAALHRKYDRFGRGPIAAITGADVSATTLRVLPRA